MCDDGFRWPAPDVEDYYYPKRISVADFTEVAEIIEWFVHHHAGPGAEAADVPLMRWVRRCKALLVVENPETVTGPFMDPESGRDEFTAIADFVAAHNLSWAIRVLQTCPAGQVVIDRALVTGELLGQDMKRDDDPSGAFDMPGAVGTIYLAARLARSGGGTVHIFGDKSKGKDIEWTPLPGATVWIECKARAFRAAYEDDVPRLVRRIEELVSYADSNMPKQEVVGRVVAFTATVSEATGEHLLSHLPEIVRNVVNVGGMSVDCVWAEVLLVGKQDDAVAAQIRVNYEETRDPPDWRPAWKAVKPHFLRLFDHL